MGLSYTGINCLETPSVIGCKRVPDPPAKSIPLTEVIVAQNGQWGRPVVADNKRKLLERRMSRMVLANLLHAYWTQPRTRSNVSVRMSYQSGEENAVHLLFVCTGNICRSPIAERLAAMYGSRMEISDLRTSSAGTHAVIAHSMHHDAAHVLAELGGSSSGFAARQFTPRVAADADLVVTMTKAHRDNVLERAPGLLRRTFTMYEVATLAGDYDAGTISDLPELRPQLAGSNLPDIADPIGQNAAVFRAVAAQLADLLPPILALCQRSTPSADD